MYARLPEEMAQFVLHIKTLSHIMRPTPILEMGRTYSLRPRSWPLIKLKFSTMKETYMVYGSMVSDF